MRCLYFPPNRSSMWVMRFLVGQGITRCLSSIPHPIYRTIRQCTDHNLLRLDKQQLTNISFHKQVTHLLLVWLQSQVAFISQKFDLRANNPCDQIWRNYATLAKYLKSWAILGVIYYWAKSRNYSGKFSTPLGNFLVI